MENLTLFMYIVGAIAGVSFFILGLLHLWKGPASILGIVVGLILAVVTITGLLTILGLHNEEAKELSVPSTEYVLDTE